MNLSNERPNLTPEQEVALRLYRRLWLTEIDLEEARGAINEVIKRNLRRASTYQPTPLLQALTTALVVAYTRPFVMSRGSAAFADRTVPG
jgi:ribosomal protein L16/L10AE